MSSNTEMKKNLKIFTIEADLIGNNQPNIDCCCNYKFLKKFALNRRLIIRLIK